MVSGTLINRKIRQKYPLFLADNPLFLDEICISILLLNNKEIEYTLYDKTICDKLLSEYNNNEYFLKIETDIYNNYITCIINYLKRSFTTMKILSKHSIYNIIDSDIEKVSNCIKLCENNI